MGSRCVTQHSERFSFLSIYFFFSLVWNRFRFAWNVLRYIKKKKEREKKREKILRTCVYFLINFVSLYLETSTGHALFRASPTLYYQFSRSPPVALCTCGQSERVYTFVGNVAIESPPPPPADKSRRVCRPRNFVPQAWKWGVFNPFYPTAGSLTRSPCLVVIFVDHQDPGVVLHAKRKCATFPLSNRSRRAQDFLFSLPFSSSLEIISLFFRKASPLSSFSRQWIVWTARKRVSKFSNSSHLVVEKIFDLEKITRSRGTCLS